MVAPAESALIGLTQAARRLGISRTTANKLVKEGNFPVRVLRVGGCWKVHGQELEDFIAGR